MGATVLVGGFFGDEGKGKIISYLALKDNPVAAVRGGVGPNAGHTVVVSGQEIKLRMLPSAVINHRTRLMLGAGVLIDPLVLADEVRRMDAADRVLIDRMCGIIEEAHRDRDRTGHLKSVVGTTGTGTGPANADRVLRSARVAKDLPDLSRYVGDVAGELNRILEDDGTVLVEGTQGTFLSLYHGAYPYVTSKDVTASAICSDVGIGPKRVDDVIVVFKAYVTRVGEGPLEGELRPDDAMQRGWQEVAVVTGRTRRAAPFNLALARRATILNSATQVALTKLDAIYPECKGKTIFEELAPEARGFIKSIEDHLGIPVTLIGTGPSAEELIDRRALLVQPE